MTRLSDEDRAYTARMLRKMAWVFTVGAAWFAVIGSVWYAWAVLS